RQRGVLDVSVILSELSDVEKIRGYYTKSASLIPVMKKRQEETIEKLQEIDESSKDIPSLL
ncbi:MAG: cell division protein FtsZ, partial [Dehalococcoidales bacterium]